MSAAGLCHPPVIPQRVAVLIPSLARDSDYEVIATRNAIAQALKAAGLDWYDLAKTCTAYAPPAGRTYPSFGDLARACRDLDRGRLKLRERQFVSDMCAQGFGYRPSPPQSAWLADIFDRLNERAAA